MLLVLPLLPVAPPVLLLAPNMAAVRRTLMSAAGQPHAGPKAHTATGRVWVVGSGGDGAGQGQGKGAGWGQVGWGRGEWHR